MLATSQPGSPHLSARHTEFTNAKVQNEEAAALLAVWVSADCRDEGDVSTRWPKSPFQVWWLSIRCLSDMVTMSSCCPNSPRHGCTLLRQSHCTVWKWPDAPGYLCHSEMLLYKYLYSLQAAKKWEEKQQLQDFFFFLLLYSGNSKNICSLRYRIGRSRYTKTNPGLQKAPAVLRPPSLLFNNPRPIHGEAAQNLQIPLAIWNEPWKYYFSLFWEQPAIVVSGPLQTAPPKRSSESISGAC